MMKKTFNSESVQGKLFDAQRSTFKCEPPVVVALRATWRARVCNPRADAFQSESDYSGGGPLAFGNIC